MKSILEPDAALDRIQIVKGWVDAEGSLHEALHDVVWSGERTRSSDGKRPPVPATVQEHACSSLIRDRP